jgi:hypothetical protein
MKRLAINMALACAVALVVAGCSPEEELESQTATQAPAEQQEAESGSLFERVLVNEYHNWRVAPGYQTPQPTEGPHGEDVQIFLNDEAADAREEAAEQWPDGSIIVKDIYVDHSIAGVAIMEKRDGHWYWGEWTSDGEMIAEGRRIQACEECHSQGTDGTLAVRIGR